MIFVIEEGKSCINETNCYSQRFHIKRMPDERQQLFQVSNCAFCVDAIFTNEFGTRAVPRAIARESFREGTNSLAKHQSVT